jgi:hypothetical protein
MLFVIIGLVVLAAILIPLFFSMDSKYTHKKCKFCRRSIKIESATCRYCKKYLLEPSED